MMCCTHDCREGRDCPKRLALQMHRVDAGSAIWGSRFFVDGGHRVSGDDSVRLPPPPCTVCSGHCPAPAACELSERPARRPFFTPERIGALIGAAAGLAAAFAMAVRMNVI